MQNVAPANVIPTRFDGTPRNKVNFAAEDFTKLILHVNHVEQTPACVFGEADENIDVTFWAKVIP